MRQPSKRKARGRPRTLDENQILRWETVWIDLFCALRDGTPEALVESCGASGILINANPTERTFYVKSGNKLSERGGRETITTIMSGQPRRTTTQPELIEIPDEMQAWQTKAKQTQEEFERTVMGEHHRNVVKSAVPHERHIWEALKRARTGAQVRRAYSRSKIWLKSRFELPSGSYYDLSWSPYPMALYRHADKFCEAKRDVRYPGRDQRRTGDYRRIEFLARVMAGLSLSKPISPSYSLEVFRKMKHATSCRCWRCTRKIGPRYSRTLAQFLMGND